MPIYQNTSEVAKPLPGCGIIAAGAFASTQKYVYPLPTAFELIEHTGSPFVLLYSGTITASSEVDGLSKYSQIIVYNKSSDDLIVTINGDPTNLYEIPTGVQIPIENEKDVEAFSFSGDNGSGEIRVWGVV